MEGGGQATGSALIKDGAAYLSSSLLESAGMTSKWDKSHRRAEFDGYGRMAAVRVGSRTGVIDSRLVDVYGAPFLYNGELYLPARFIAAALEGGPVEWDAKHRIVSAGGLHTFAGASQTYGGMTYSIHFNTGELFVKDGSGRTRKLANLGSKLYEGAQMDFAKTPGGLMLLTITNNYGEPHLNNHIYTLVLKNGAVIRQSDVLYWNRFEQNVTRYGNRLLLTNGRTLRVIEDGTGNVTDTLNLVKLGGEDDNYFVEGAGDDFLLIRPNKSGLLTLVDRKTGASVKLYDKLLDAEDAKYAVTNDVPFYGDYLKYAGRKGAVLYFKNNSPLRKDNRLYSYTLPVKTAEPPANSQS